MGLGGEKKQGFNLQAKLAALAEKDRAEENKQVVDPHTVKVGRIYKDVTTEDLEEIMS